jgi:peptidoglycan/LPS O-acetylase OafA/YrhL
VKRVAFVVWWTLVILCFFAWPVLSPMSFVWAMAVVVAAVFVGLIAACVDSIWREIKRT